jgi:hypothetical protein
MAKRVHTCPECGSNTVVENETIVGITYKVERCDGLIETDPNKPLAACMWSQELGMVSHGIVTEGYNS